MAAMVLVNYCNAGHFAYHPQCLLNVSYSGSSSWYPEIWKQILTNMQIPIGAWLVAFTKVVYDRELAISEKSVKPASILHNTSLILGKQIIHILPEGYVDNMWTFPYSHTDLA